MSYKQLVLDTVQQLPEECTMDEILDHLAHVNRCRLEKLKALLREGMQGEPIPVTDAFWDDMLREYDKDFPTDRNHG